MKKIILGLGLMIFVTLQAMANAADTQRLADVTERGKDVMPFSLEATTHIFMKTTDGGTQRVVAKNNADAGQIRFVRQHLRDIRTQFKKGDYSGPAHIHGNEMPGLAKLKSAKPGQIAIKYHEVEGGAELTYRTRDSTLVAALHAWFDAQLADHGSDAMEGHQHSHGDMKMN